MTGSRDRLPSSTSTSCCSHCSSTVTRKDKGLQCDRCDDWFHLSCRTVPELLYEHLPSVSGILWVSSNCLTTAKQLLKDKSDPHSLKVFIEKNMSETLKNVVQSSISPALKGINDKLHLSVELVSQLWEPSEDGVDVTNSRNLTTLAENVVTKPFSVP